MALGGGEELVAGEPGRQGRLQIQCHHRDEIMMLSVAPRWAGTDIIGVAAGPGAADEILRARRAFAFQEFMQTEAAADAMKHDGVHPETLLILSEG